MTRTSHEQELITLAGLDGALDQVAVASVVDRGFCGMAKPRQHWHAPVADRRTNIGTGGHAAVVRHLLSVVRRRSEPS